MEAAGVWKAPGRHPPTPGPSHTPWKSWAPAPRPPRIPTAPTAPATRSYILLGKTRKEAPRRPLEPNTSRRPSLRSDEWSPSSEQVVAFVGIRILPGLRRGPEPEPGRLRLLAGTCSLLKSSSSTADRHLREP